MDDRPLLHDRYRIVRRLGRGAFATVYLADDLRMERPVAVKVVEDSIDLDGRALREARAAAKLDHPHIVTVHEVVRESDRTLLFTEYVEGHTLRELYVKRRLSPHEILEAGIQMARALEHAHKRGVVHRDIKPENVMLVAGDDVDVRIMDFGVAQLEDQLSITREGDLVGTLAYMAPEQLAGGEVGPRADVYALAVTLYEGLAGENPVRGKATAELLKPGFKPVFRRLSRMGDELPVALDEALERALETDPEGRVDAHAFRRLLEGAARQMPEPELRLGLFERAEQGLLGGMKSERSRFIMEHLLSGLLVFAAVVLAAFRIPFYPLDVRIPLVAASSFLALLWPSGGGLVALAVIAAPVFGFSTAWGVLFLAVCLPAYGLLLWRKKVWAAFFPTLFVLFGSLGAFLGPIPAGVGLALPLLAGLTLGYVGPLMGFFGGVALAVAAGFQGWEVLPFTFTQGGEAVLLSTIGEGSPAAAVVAFARLLDARLELALQIGVLTVFSLPFARLMRNGLAVRLWAAAGYVVLLFAAYVLLPGLVAGHPAEVGPLVLAFLPCAIITVLLALLLPSNGGAAVGGGSDDGSRAKD
jgi:hypothetical protein